MKESLNAQQKIIAQLQDGNLSVSWLAEKMHVSKQVMAYRLYVQKSLNTDDYFQMQLIIDAELRRKGVDGDDLKSKVLTVNNGIAMQLVQLNEDVQRAAFDGKIDVGERELLLARVDEMERIVGELLASFRGVLS